MNNGHHPDNRPEFFVDRDPYQWGKPVITGAEIRKLAGLGDDIQIFQKIPGRPDREIKDDTRVDLRPPGPERFSTQAVGSQAG